MKDFLKFITRLDNIVLLVCLILMGAVVCYGENGPTPQTFVGSTGISDGSITSEKIADDAVGAAEIDETSSPAVNNLTVTGTLGVTGLVTTTYYRQNTESNAYAVQKIGNVSEYLQGYAVTNSITDATPFAPLYNYTWPASYSGRLTLYDEANKETAVIVCRQGASPEFRLVEDSGNIFAVSDTAGKYCVYSSGGVLRIKNNTGNYGSLHIKWEGTP